MNNKINVRRNCNNVKKQKDCLKLRMGKMIRMFMRSKLIAMTLGLT